MNASNPLDILKRLLNTPDATPGVVISALPNGVRVATEFGIRAALYDPALKTGDRVTLKNGRATLAPTAAAAYSV